MAGEPLSYWDYVKAAFWKPVRTRVLGRHAAHPDAARLLRPRRLRQPRLLAARPRRDRGLRGRPLVERAVPEARARPSAWPRARAAPRTG